MMTLAAINYKLDQINQHAIPDQVSGLINRVMLVVFGNSEDALYSND